METLLKNLKVLQPEIDYQALMAQMPNHSHPRRQLKVLQDKGQLIRVKKGFYVFSPDFIGRDYSPLIVANLLYGPSYLSLESALAFYRLIPERVITVTSITSQKNKRFETPIGRFTYHHLACSLYPFAVTIKKTVDQRGFLIASPEKALLDIFTLKFDSSMRVSTRDIRVALEDDLRVNLVELKTHLNRTALENMRRPYRNRRWARCFIKFMLEEL